MSFMVIAVAMLAAFCLQFLFQMVQMKSFNKFYTKLRKKGRVAIGKENARSMLHHLLFTWMKEVIPM